MDYTEIVLRGYFDPNSRNFLSKYFVRECKIAEQQFYTQEEFFAGCLDVIKSLQFPIEFRFSQRKEELKKLSKQAKFEKNLASIKYCKKELIALKKENFTVPLSSFKKGSFPGQINYLQIEYIENAINEAISICSPMRSFEAKHDLRNEAKEETTAGKISRILEPLRTAFENTGSTNQENGIKSPGHIDKIIEGFVSFKIDNKLPGVNKAIVSIDMIEFIKPFKKLQDLKILKREQISMLLLYFIKQNDMNEKSYSQGYINKKLSQSRLD